MTVGGADPGSSAGVAKYLIALPGRANHRDPVRTFHLPGGNPESVATAHITDDGTPIADSATCKRKEIGMSDLPGTADVVIVGGGSAGPT